MDIKVLDNSFDLVGMLDSAESIIWKEAFNGAGTFEIYSKYTEAQLELLQIDYYLQTPESERTMIIEEIITTTDPEGGDKLVVSGRTIESLLDRRIVLRQTRIDTTFQNGIFTLLNENVINGLYPERNYPNFVFVNSTDPVITGMNLKAQFYSEYILDVITNLCSEAGVGFRLFLNASNQFEFKLLAGTDRSYGQTDNSPIIFSPEFDNLVNSTYYRSVKDRKNYVLVTGNAPAAFPNFPYRKQAWVPPAGTGTGLLRREMAVDATDMPLVVHDSSGEIPEAEYLAQLEQRGLEELSNRQELVLFDGQIRVNVGGYIYGQDYFLGDIVQIQDNYGHVGSVQIDEMTISENLTEKTMYPTLKSI
jgi:hypothetical protein